MRCLIVQPIHEAGHDRLRESGVEPVQSPAPDMDTVSRVIAGCNAVITRDAGLFAAAFEAADRLRVVAVHGAGHDPVDKAAAARKGVTICNTPGANARSVAELSLRLAIAAARGIAAVDYAVRAGKAGFREAHRFTELTGKTALIVGWGAIGKLFGRMLDDCLGMRVLVYSPCSPTTGGYQAARSLHDGLGYADLVSLHTPLRDETRNLMGTEAFEAVRPGAILVNTARGGLVDEPALFAVIQSGRLQAAALDVYSLDAPGGPLGTMPRVIFTPHLGGTTEEALRRTALAAAERVITALTGKTPPTTVNPRGLLGEPGTGK